MQKSNKSRLFLSIALMALCIFYFFDIACSPTSAEDKRKVTCTAGCSSMSWGITDESGSKTISSSCIRVYSGYTYVETCTGTLTYNDSGNSYDFETIYDWPNCKITVTVEGVGKCTDQVSDFNMAKDCNCEGINLEDLITIQKD